MFHHIFDLDGTVICSKHRQRLKPNGDLDLAHWIANRGDRELVFKDQLLPLSVLWRAIQSRGGEAPAICTSRVISQHEHDFLAMHGLRFGHFMHRDNEDMRGDADYKVAKIRAHLDATGWEAARTTLYDDHAGVRQAVRGALGVRTFDPVPFNVRGFRLQALKVA